MRMLHFLRRTWPASLCAAVLLTTTVLPVPAHAACSSSRGGWRTTSIDRWTGTDKLEHFGVSAGFGAMGAYLVKDTDHPVLYGAGLGLIPGLAKEVFDGTCRSDGFSYKDLTADAVGAITGAILGHWAITYVRGPAGATTVGMAYHTRF